MPRNSLEELRIQIENEDIDPIQAEKLKNSIQRGLDNPDDHQTLLEELEESLLIFSENHPKLAAALQSAINALSLGGI